MLSWFVWLFNQGARFPSGTSVDLDMKVVLVHGDEVVADSNECGGLLPACEKYSQWLKTLQI